MQETYPVRAFVASLQPDGGVVADGALVELHAVVPGYGPPGVRAIASGHQMSHAAKHGFVRVSLVARGYDDGVGFERVLAGTVVLGELCAVVVEVQADGVVDLFDAGDGAVGEYAVGPLLFRWVSYSLGVERVVDVLQQSDADDSVVRASIQLQSFCPDGWVLTEGARPGPGRRSR